MQKGCFLFVCSAFWLFVASTVFLEGVFFIYSVLVELPGLTPPSISFPSFLYSIILLFCTSSSDKNKVRNQESEGMVGGLQRVFFLI